MDQGLLVGDDVVIGLVRERIAQDDAVNGFLYWTDFSDGATSGGARNYSPNKVLR